MNLLKKQKHGFGLIEVLIASSILIMFLAAGVVLINASYKNVVVGKHKLQATLLAKQEIAEKQAIRDSAYFASSGFPSGSFPLTGTPCIPITTTYNEDLTTSGIFFTKETCIDDLNLGLIGRKITTTVSWNDYGQEHSAELYTYLLDWQNP